MQHYQGRVLLAKKYNKFFKVLNPLDLFEK